jgi:hypothetical protein
MSRHLKDHLQRAFQLTRDFVEHLDDSALTLDLPDLPSNRIAGQIWCIVGARESYLRAIEAGAWQGFACSLKSQRVKQEILTALEATRAKLGAIEFASLADQQIELAFALLEHEVQHHGQLIRFVYANGLTFPKSWNARYTV